MSKTAHTPGPWYFDAKNGFVFQQREPLTKYVIAELQSSNEDNGPRIAACVNACEGFAKPEAVPEAIEALRHLTAHVAAAKMAFPHDPVEAGGVVRRSLSFSDFERAAAILAKLEGSEA